MTKDEAQRSRWTFYEVVNNYLKKKLYMQSIILIMWSWIGEEGRGIKKVGYFLNDVLKRQPMSRNPFGASSQC